MKIKEERRPSAAAPLSVINPFIIFLLNCLTDFRRFLSDLVNFFDFGLLRPGILVPGFGVPEVRGPDFKSLSSRHAASGGSKFSKMTPPEFQRSFRLHFWQLSRHKTPNHHTLKMKSVIWG